jgi:hypothetical protein
VPDGPRGRRAVGHLVPLSEGDSQCHDHPSLELGGGRSDADRHSVVGDVLSGPVAGRQRPLPEPEGGHPLDRRPGGDLSSDLPEGVGLCGPLGGQRVGVGDLSGGHPGPQEPGERRLAFLFEEVGQHQPGGVVGRAGEDGGQE